MEVEMHQRLWTVRSSDTKRIRCLMNETSSEMKPNGTS